MSLANADARRGLRSAVMAVVVLSLLYFIWIWAERLDHEALRETVRAALILIGIAQVGYQMENSIRAFKLSVSKDGLTASAEGDASGKPDEV
jgi:regulatory protein YycH of two-component signal transduction system YycFG